MTPPKPQHPHKSKKHHGRGSLAKNDKKSSATQVSRALSWALRHNAPMLKLRMTSDGYCPVQDILEHSHPKLAQITSMEEHIRPAVETNEKQRYRLELRPAQLYLNEPQNPWAIIPLTPQQASPVDEATIALLESAEASATHESESEKEEQKSPDFIWCIRANQGHSLEGINPEFLLQEIPNDELAAMPTIVHGTYFEAWRQIQDSGFLSRMNRTHIHCAAGLLNSTNEKGEVTVISGMRASCQVHIYISGAHCAKQGIRFFRSDNGVLLTAGVGDEGKLPLSCVSHVTDQHGEVLLDQRAG
eukprot:CAMPEP_0172461998 /NCGR_PEP_ID=MMETSP1065-20121228/42399_1 /TAXON_ID=265537 /ORGANISM="Amphiprora paludosa, Strain CCMP125" /LENGTH=301 /DNA_ID=CAMNT_0013217521 /DNA_START=65 /DNA_END=970 /DNA_ORIENTATION=-